MGSDLLLVLVVATALAFDFTNGFHDTANAMATSIATKAIPPRAAVLLAAVMNFAGAFISIAVATTIAKGVVDNDVITLGTLLAGLVGAIAWNLVTWLKGLPSSSSHALIGGVVGATLAAQGADAVNGSGILERVIVPALLAPLIAGAIAVLATFTAYKLMTRFRESTAQRGYRIGQIGTASLVSLAHGTNDAQKTMGIITLALIAHGSLSGDVDTIPLWVKLASATAIAAGTAIGGWRIIQTMGHGLVKLEPPMGFSAEASGGAVLMASSYYGFPLSTTHIVSGSILGAGVGKRLADVHWGLAGRMVAAWLLTLPSAALVAGVAWYLTDGLGGDSVGPPVLFGLAAIGAVGLFVVAQKRPVTPADV
ncbi:anion permease [Baekduia sp. Peel2402]|uniref:anion permease n=1 Tax=Baekduia sp. Peel2402 TaxID=3458296 RepID=UPI00403EC1A2